MRRPARYVMYFVLGFLIYQMIDSGETSITHQDARNWLIGGMVIVFILMLIVRAMKQRHDDNQQQ